MEKLGIDIDKINLGEGIDKIKEEIQYVKTIINEIQDSYKPIRSLETFHTDDIHINALIKINEINVQYTKNLLLIETQASKIIEKLKSFIDHIENFVSSIVFEYKKFDKPKKYIWFLISGIFLSLLSISTADSFDFSEEGSIAFLIVCIVSALICNYVWISRLYQKKKYQIYKKKTHPDAKKQFLNESKIKINKIVNKVIKEYELFIKQEENTISYCETKILENIMEYTNNLSPYNNEYSTFIDDPGLLCVCLNAVSNKRAFTINEAINIVQNDRHLKKVENLQKEQLKYAKETAYQAERKAQIAEEQLKIEKEKTEILKKSMRK